MSFTGDHLTPQVDEGLDSNACLIGLGDGRALAVEASRDPRALRNRRGPAVLRTAPALPPALPPPQVPHLIGKSSRTIGVRPGEEDA